MPEARQDADRDVTIARCCTRMCSRAMFFPAPRNVGTVPAGAQCGHDASGHPGAGAARAGLSPRTLAQWSGLDPRDPALARDRRLGCASVHRRSGKPVHVFPIRRHRARAGVAGRQWHALALRGRADAGTGAAARALPFCRRARRDRHSLRRADPRFQSDVAAFGVFGRIAASAAGRLDAVPDGAGADVVVVRACRPHAFCR